MNYKLVLIVIGNGMKSNRTMLHFMFYTLLQLLTNKLSLFAIQ
jgi:hypothetical protein